MHVFISILSQITAEPTVFFLAIGNSLENGARITTDLLINKICHFELNYDANGIDNELSKINPVSECGYFSGTTSSICADVLANIF